MRVTSPTDSAKQLVNLDISSTTSALSASDRSGLIFTSLSTSATCSGLNGSVSLVNIDLSSLCPLLVAWLCHYLGCCLLLSILLPVVCDSLGSPNLSCLWFSLFHLSSAFWCFLLWHMFHYLSRCPCGYWPVSHMFHLLWEFDGVFLLVVYCSKLFQ